MLDAYTKWTFMIYHIKILKKIQTMKLIEFPCFLELQVIEQNFQRLEYRNASFIELTFCFHSDIIHHHLLCD